jgi:hypothetical protein
MNQKILEKSKELRLLQAQLNKAQNQLNRMMIKNIVSKVPYLLSSNKWRIENFYISVPSDDCDEKCEDDSFEEKVFLSITAETDPLRINGSIPTPAAVAIPLAKKSRKSPTSKSVLFKKKRASKPFSYKLWDKQIKNYRDFYNLCSDFDMHRFVIDNCLVKIEYESVKICAENCDSIFAFIRKNKMSISLNSFIKNIEENEYFLKKKKELFRDLSASMLFDV